MLPSIFCLFLPELDSERAEADHQTPSGIFPEASAVNYRADMNLVIL